MDPGSAVGPIRPGLLDAVAPRGAENFITNAFCWLLKHVPGLGKDYLRFLRKRAEDPKRGFPTPEDEHVEWNTQTPFPREGKRPIRPDMTCTYGKHGIVFEHKTWRVLSPGQLPEYRKHAPKPFQGSPIILITAHPGQHAQCPDLALLWSDVHKFLSDFRKSRDLDREADFTVREFQHLLRKRGLGPMENLSVEEVRSYRPVKRTLSSILEAVAERDWKGNNDRRKVRLEWGRLGFMVRGEQSVLNASDCPTWDPGVFVGVLLDGWDHSTRPSRPESGPDACVIVSVCKDLHTESGESSDCERLAEQLSTLKRSEASHPLRDWEIYRHALEQARDDGYGHYPGRNPWHPLHIRRPLAHVLAGTDSDTGQQQAERFYKELRSVADVVVDNLEAPWTRD